MATDAVYDELEVARVDLLLSFLYYEIKLTNICLMEKKTAFLLLFLVMFIYLLKTVMGEDFDYTYQFYLIYQVVWELVKKLHLFYTFMVLFNILIKSTRLDLFVKSSLNLAHLCI